MIRVHYTPYVSETGTTHNPIAMTDQACEEAYANLLARQKCWPTYDQDWNVQSENFYNRIRLGIVTGELDHEVVRFVVGDQEVQPNRFGALRPWPEGFCMYNVDLRSQILRAVVEKRRAEREVGNADVPALH